MAYYGHLREHIAALESKGKLVRIKREINKDTEFMPLVRWQFRGLPEEERGGPSSLKIWLMLRGKGMMSPFWLPPTLPPVRYTL